MQLESLELSPKVREYINKLQTRIEEIQNQYESSLNNIIELKNQYLEIKERYDLLVYKRFVRSAEEVIGDKSQQLLFGNEGEQIKPSLKSNPGEVEQVKSYSRKKRGRKAIDPHIPREDKVIDIPESEKRCACGAELSRIGEETSEKLHIIPPRMFVEKIIRPKYACRRCEGTDDEDKPAVRIAPVEPSIIPRSIVSPSLLSCVLIQKYEDHLPYYRQERQFERIGVIISRQDMSNWQQKAYEKLSPLFKLLKEIITQGPVMQMDETTVQVMGEEGRLDTDKSYMWLACGGPPGKTVVLYEYRQTRAATHAKNMLEGYQGYLQTDGYSGYDCAVKELPGIVHVGCFAHCRRHFFEAAKISEQGGIAKEGIAYIRRLYDIERKVRELQKKKKLPDKKFVKKRRARAGPVLMEFRQWLLKQKREVPPSLLLGKAIHYSLSQWDKLTRYLGSQYLTPDTNFCENLIRPFVLGRKNYLFHKSPEGAESSCGIYSLIATAKQNGLKPLDYLTALFEKAPYAKSAEAWEKLLPWNIFSK